MAKPTKREYELSSVILCQDAHIAELKQVIRNLKSRAESLETELEQAYTANQYLIDQMNES